MVSIDLHVNKRRGSGDGGRDRAGGGGNELRNRLRLDWEREGCWFSRKSKLPARADAMGFLDDAFALASFLSFIFLIRWANKMTPSFGILKIVLGFVRFEA